MIEGGYILLARKMFESNIMDKPPHYLKLWVWMLGKAFWKNGDKLQRGQLLTTISEMQNACGYHVGARHERPSKDQIRNCYEHLTNTHMITTTKTTRGLLVTICNYEYYQNPQNYEHHDENSTKTLRKPRRSHTIEEEGKEEKYIADFDKVWTSYPNKLGKKAAERHFRATVKTEEDFQNILYALNNYQTHLKCETWKKPQNGSTWFNNWQDWIPNLQPAIPIVKTEEDLRWEKERAARREDMARKEKAA